MRAPELLAEVAVRPPAGGHAMSKGHAYSPCPATSTTQCCPSSSCRRATSGTSYWGTTAWNHGRSSCTADPSVNNMSKPQTPQDRERGDELTARVFAPGGQFYQPWVRFCEAIFLASAVCSGLNAPIDRSVIFANATTCAFVEQSNVRQCLDGAVRHSRTNRRASRAIVGI